MYMALTSAILKGIYFFFTRSTTTLAARQRKWRGARKIFKQHCQLSEIFE